MRLYIFTFVMIGFVGAACQTSNEDQDKVVSKENTYSEMHRPQYHFTPPEKWMNDPNGMVYYEGEYHLFYQYYPDSTVWGPMHWGHAVSRDMIYWEQLPIALYPDSLGYIFSGSVVVDWNNTSGLGQEGEPPLVAIYTQALEDEKMIPQRQSIAFSLDKGRTWEKYEGNPVLDEGLRAFRDPKVFWHEETSAWIMSVAATTDNVGIRPDHIRFYSSGDLKSWEYLSEFGTDKGSQEGNWECPDLFKLKVENSDEEKWVLLVSINPGGPNGGSATQYFVGDFDGKEFRLEDDFLKNGPVWLDHGRDNYAGVTWSDIPKDDGRRIFIGWMSNWDYGQEVPTEEWRSAMTLPRELRLVNHNGNYLVSSLPAKEVESLRTSSHEIPPYTIAGEFDISNTASHASARFELELELIPQEKFDLIFSNSSGDELKLSVDPILKKLVLDRDKAGNTSFSPKFKGLQESPLYFQGDSLNIRLFLDESSIEIFAADGLSVITSTHFPAEPFNHVKLITTDATYFGSIKIHDLSRIWP